MKSGDNMGRRSERPQQTGTLVGVRLQPEELVALDAWISRQDQPLTRPQALRQLAFATLPVVKPNSSRWFRGVLEQYLAPGIASLTSVDIPNVAAAHPEAAHWLGNHLLNSVFTGGWIGTYKILATNLMYRGQSALLAYSAARDLTLSFTHASVPGRPISCTYFAALRSWEAALSHVQIPIDLMVKFTGSNLFTKRDGSDCERAYMIANEIKHHNEAVLKWDGQAPLTVPMWLTNEGFQTTTTALSFHEFSEIVDGLANMANDLQNPTALIERLKSRNDSAE